MLLIDRIGLKIKAFIYINFFFHGYIITLKSFNVLTNIY